jgi:hypothetical protein
MQKYVNFAAEFIFRLGLEETLISASKEVE